MNETTSPSPYCCPRCGAENDPGRPACWLCLAPLAAEPPVSPFAAGTPSPPETPVALAPPVAMQRTFTLSSLFLVMTLIAVCLGVSVRLPGVGIPLAILCTPALIRTMLIRRRRRAKGQSMTAGDKALAFAGSLAVVTTIAVASVGAFVGICFSLGLAAFAAEPSAFSIPLMILAWVLGIGVGLTVAFFLVRWLWRRKDY